MRKMILSGMAGAVLGSALILATAPAQAQDAPPPGGRDLLARADANGDGVVTKAELLADVDKRFARLDTDKDGKITAAEREAMGGGMRGRMARRMMERRGGEGGMGRALERVDTNDDGIITLDEQRAAATQRFAYMDRNSDGKVDQAERDALRDMTASMRGPDGHRAPPPPAGSPNAPRSE